MSSSCSRRWLLGRAAGSEPPQPLRPGLLLPLPLPLLHLRPRLHQPPLLLLAAAPVRAEMLPTCHSIIHITGHHHKLV